MVPLQTSRVALPGASFHFLMKGKHLTNAASLEHLYDTPGLYSTSDSQLKFTKIQSLRNVCLLNFIHEIPNVETVFTKKINLLLISLFSARTNGLKSSIINASLLILQTAFDAKF
jgi:hypothetical protein